MTAIEWTDATWNPVAGCSVISPGCSNCYAMRMAARLESMGLKKYGGLTRRSGGRSVWTGRVNLDRATLEQPLRWRRPRMVFVNSMSDLFHEAVPEAFIRDVWSVMAACPQHTFQILTKRSERMAVVSAGLPLLNNVWLGVSVEDADHVRRIEDLKRVLAIIRFVSFEPLLGPVGHVDLSHVDWAIVGGESGPRSRPVDRDWVDGIYRQCARDGVAFFFKQWGGRNKKKAGRQFRGREWSEYPSVPVNGLSRPASGCDRQYA